MNATSNFKMSKQTKRMLSLSKFRSPEQKNNFKKLMILAQLSGAVVTKLPKGAESDNG